MRPIFEIEREFLSDELGIEIPSNCWVNRRLIYCDGEKVIKFTVKENKVVLAKDHRKEGKEYKAPSFYEQAKNHAKHIKEIEEEAIEFIKKSSTDYKKHYQCLSYSGGKDSEVILDLIEKSGIDFDIIFSDTTNEMPSTYKKIMEMKKHYGDRLHWTKPKEGMYKFFKNENFIPTRQGRACCTHFKKYPLKRFIENHDNNLLNFNGVRRAESLQRSKRPRINENPLYGKLNGIAKITDASPIITWDDKDVWYYMFYHNLPFNSAYELGFSRVGCSICPYQSNYDLVVIDEHYHGKWKTYKKLLHNHWTSINQQKLQFAKMLDEGCSDEEIKEKLGLHTRRFNSWKKRFLDGERGMHVGYDEYMDGRWRG